MQRFRWLKRGRSAPPPSLHLIPPDGQQIRWPCLSALSFHVNSHQVVPGKGLRWPQNGKKTHRFFGNSTFWRADLSFPSLDRGKKDQQLPWHKTWGNGETEAGDRDDTTMAMLSRSLLCWKAKAKEIQRKRKDIKANSFDCHFQNILFEEEPIPEYISAHFHKKRHPLRPNSIIQNVWHPFGMTSDNDPLRL